MSTPALPEESAAALTESQRLLYTFTAPAKTMADLRRNASWWVPWLLVSIVSVGFAYTLDKKIGWAQAVESVIQSTPKAAEKLEKVTPEQRDNAMKVQETTERIKGYASPVTNLLMLAAMAWILLGIFNFGFGAKLRFGEMMAVTAYSFLPTIFGFLLTIVVMFCVEPDAFNLQNPVATNVGYFVPASAPFLKSLLEVFDVFTLWQVFLLTVGVSQLSKVGKWTAFATIFSLLFLIELAWAGFSVM